MFAVLRSVIAPARNVRVRACAQSTAAVAPPHSHEATQRSPLTKGRVSPRRTVPPGILLPPYALSGQVAGFPPAQIHGAEGIARMREACAVAADVLSYAGHLVVPGVTTEELDAQVHEYCVATHKVYPSPLNYAGFPKSVCTSLNEVVCHGIPDDTVIQAGDLVKLDVSTYVKGYHGDTCRTFLAGGLAATDDTGARLTRVTKRCLDEAIAICGPGVPVPRIGCLIHDILDAEGFTPVTAFGGHGVGSTFHTQPMVWHYRTGGQQPRLEKGMTFTIEPMVCEGQPDVKIWADGWTAVTADGLRAAQFEHSLLVTEHGVEVLTAYE